MAKTSKPKPEPKAPVLVYCHCGCGAETRNAFAPGHDNRFYGQVLRGERPVTDLAKFPGLSRKFENRTRDLARKEARKAETVDSIGTDSQGKPILVDENDEFIDPGDRRAMEWDESDVTESFTQVKDGRWWREIVRIRPIEDGLFEVDFQAKNGNARTVRVGLDKLK